MKIETTIVEATAVVKDQVRATRAMLEVVEGNLEAGNVKGAYSACNFDLVKMTAANLEELAASLS